MTSFWLRVYEKARANCQTASTTSTASSLEGCCVLCKTIQYCPGSQTSKLAFGPRLDVCPSDAMGGGGEAHRSEQYNVTAGCCKHFGICVPVITARPTTPAPLQLPADKAPGAPRLLIRNIEPPEVLSGDCPGVKMVSAQRGYVSKYLGRVLRYVLALLCMDDSPGSTH